MAYEILKINEGPKKMAKKRGKRKSKRAAAPKARRTHRRRRSAPSTTAAAPARRYGKRRKNPSGMIGTVLSGTAGALGASLVAGMVGKWNMGNPIGDWTLFQYAAAAGVGYLAGKTKIAGLDGHAVAAGAYALAGYKLIQGLGGDKLSFLGATDGEIRTDDNGQTYIAENGTWQPMQGLVVATPMDGMGALVPANRMDSPFTNQMSGVTNTSSLLSMYR